jgi:hypothetical protein
VPLSGIVEPVRPVRVRSDRSETDWCGGRAPERLSGDEGHRATIKALLVAFDTRRARMVTSIFFTLAETPDMFRKTDRSRRDPLKAG